MRAFQLIILGDVQGVGFRNWMKREATQLGVTGWVKNRDDGAVEACIQGDDKEVGLLVKKVTQGPETALVRDVFVQDIPTDKTQDTFTVLY